MQQWIEKGKLCSVRFEQQAGQFTLIEKQPKIRLLLKNNSSTLFFPEAKSTKKSFIVAISTILLH